MVENKYDASGHIIIPYNEEIKNILFKQVTQNEWKLTRNGVLLQNTSGLNKEFVDKYLKKHGYSLTKKKRNSTNPIKKLNGVPIGITKLVEDGNIVEILVTVHAKDMRSLIEKCDLCVRYIEDSTQIKIDKKAKVWTRQEAC